MKGAMEEMVSLELLEENLGPAARGRTEINGIADVGHGGEEAELLGQVKELERRPGTVA